ncbi:uncharacterized protein N7515_001806 [Penicillium bovifimosum]|uniref:Uncharacterized protein n=1 Tax=Penicillium bovifimosum TaxID=126998 RepID=A0A9W9HAE9_9EURO|nr:uncharacterized protein N7515_001806 [Penicillium bovifimosum]KAJ5143019.1 hypothetical protein N7515_001806 [Penicillium bovifimosum]
MPAWPYQQSTKIPDVAVTPDDADMELLLRGSERQIQRGLTIKWYLQRRTGTEETIFRRHQSGPQVLSLTRGQLWRGSLDAMHSLNEVVNLDLDLLRVQASKALAKMGLAPAT